MRNVAQYADKVTVYCYFLDNKLSVQNICTKIFPEHFHSNYIVSLTTASGLLALLSTGTK